MTAYYNENDKKAAEWLRRLIAKGLIADGVVDTRSIAEVMPGDIAGHDQVHLFAGIGGWSLALRLAGVPDDEPVWTGSCPCQPFSAAGKKKAQADDRHLWPDFFRLIKECKPNVVFGEQVEGAIRHGWLDGIQADLEGEGYAVGHCVLGAHSVGAPHIRQRLFWVADAEYAKRRPEHEINGEAYGRHRLGWSGAVGGMGDADEPGPQGRCVSECECPSERTARATGGDVDFWRNAIGIPCRDGKTRRIEPGIKPLAHGLPGRLVRLRGYGNAIVPPLAAEFIETFYEARAVTWK